MPFRCDVLRAAAQQAQGYWQLSDQFRATTGPAERRRPWFSLPDEYDAEAPAVILYPVREIFGKRRNIRFNHYPLYYTDFRGNNLGFT